jgi:pyruvyltransferase
MKRLWSRVLKTLEIAKSSERYVLANWSNSLETSRNWGDALNTDLIRRISGKELVHIKAVYNWKGAPVYNVIGSTLDSMSVRHLEVWGSGFKRAVGLVRRKPQRVHAVRGPLTRKRLQEWNIPCPEVFGDPAMLCPKFFEPASNRAKYPIGIIAHYVDAKHPWISAIRASRPDVRVIDICGGIQNVIREATECRLIASSSLHGLILADAYGIPSTWLRFSDDIVGGDFKFHDHLLSVDKPLVSPLRVLSSTEVSEMEGRATAPPARFDFSALWQACPFRKEGLGHAL